MVLDFSTFKQSIQKFLDEHFDHKFLVNKRFASRIMQTDETAISIGENTARHLSIIANPEMVCELDFDPTSENLAEFIFNKLGTLFDKGNAIKVSSVRIYEGENNYAQYP